MLLKRGIFGVTERLMAGEWPRTELMGLEAAGRTFGLIGYGAISREVAVRAKSLGMTVIAYDPYIEPNSSVWGNTSRTALDEVIQASDVISCHIPLTSETRHIINKSAISRMRTGAIIINASRGGVVDEKATRQT